MVSLKFLFESNYDRIESYLFEYLQFRITLFESNYDRIERPVIDRVQAIESAFESNYDRIESTTQRERHCSL